MVHVTLIGLKIKATHVTCDHYVAKNKVINIECLRMHMLSSTRIAVGSNELKMAVG